MQVIKDKKFSEYRVTEADKDVFTKLLCIWNKITEMNAKEPKSVVEDIKLCKEYVEELSKLEIGDKIIVSWDGMELDRLYSKTQDYSLQLHYDSVKSDIKYDLSALQEKYTITQQNLKEYQLPQLLDIIIKAQTGQSYIEYLEDLTINNRRR